MTPLVFTPAVFGSSIVAGRLGSSLGLGGGIIVIPVLAKLLHVDIRYAIGASTVSVIATSSGAAAAYVRERLGNLRVTMVLEMVTVTGAPTGAFISSHLHPRWLFMIFGIMRTYSAMVMLQLRCYCC